MKTLVIGVGNLLRCDDGAGVHVVNMLEDASPNIDTMDAAMGSIEILEAMKGYDRVIIVDAILTGAAPGTVFRVNVTEGEQPPRMASSHGVDLPTTLELGRRLFPDEMPGELHIIGIEAGDITTLCMECTAPVWDAVYKVVEDIRSLT